jgi:hypothetical protein
MIAFLPIDIETADLQSSIVIDYDSAEYGADWQGEWSAGSYDEGDVVYKGVELYEALTTTSDDPEDGVDADPATWLALGKVSRWRAFDEYTNTVSEDTDEIIMILDVDDVSHLALFNLVANDLTVEILDRTALLNTAHWTASGSGTNEYYYTGTPPSSKPDCIDINGTVADEGTLGSLAAGEWGWGDNDTLGADTIYVRLSDGTDPDTKAADYLAYRTVGWEYNYDLQDAALEIGDWWEYYYSPYPPAQRDIIIELGYMLSQSLGDKLRITLEGSGTIECGMCTMGASIEIGATRWSPEAGAIDYSKKTTDSFGRTTLTKGKNAKLIRGNLIIPSGSESYVYRQLTNLLGLAAVWNFNETSTDYDPLLVYGFIQDFRETIVFLTYTECSLSIEGLI